MRFCFGGENRGVLKKAAILLVSVLLAFWLFGFALHTRYDNLALQSLVSLVPLALFFAVIACYNRFGATVQKWKDYPKTVRAAAGALAAIFLAYAFATLYVLTVKHGWFATAGDTFSMFVKSALAGSNFLRAAILLPVATLFTFFVLCPVREVLDFVLRRRWVIALFCFLLLLLCRANISNVSAMDAMVQPSYGGDLSGALLGVPRGIRSDEWLVNLPSLVSTDHAGYGEINSILRGTDNYSLPATSLQLGYSMLSNPLNLGYYLFGAEVGASFFWSATLILSVMLAFEFGYIISGKKPLMGLLGIALIGLSPFSVWWSICALMNGWLGIVVGAYYCFHATRFRDRALFMLAVAFSGAYFVCRFYPAWQVPMVYLLLAMFAWLIWDNFPAIRRFQKRDWLTAAGCVLFMASIILAHLWDIREYSKEIMSTVYPGSRFETGGYALQKPFAFIQTLLLPFRGILVGSNNSEAATFFALFPLPILLSIYSLVRQVVAKVKDRTRSLDHFTLVLLIPTLFFLVYTTVGIPAWLSKVTLMSYVPAERAADWLAFANAVLLIRFVSSELSYRIPATVAALLTGAVLANSIMHALAMCPGYMDVKYTVLASALAMALGMAAFGEVKPREKTAVLCSLSVLLILIGFFVNPINSGIGALTKKPVAREIQSIVAQDPDSKWIGYGGIIAGPYAVANGAPCITSTNYVPNMALWTRLDPTGAYNEVYNRYAHVTLTFTDEETSFSLFGADHMSLQLSYEDIHLTEAKYLFALQPVDEESDVIDLKLLYQEENAWIYEIVYLN